VGHHRDSLARVTPGELAQGEHTTRPELAIALAAGPAEIVVVLAEVRLPQLGPVTLDLIDE